MLVLSELARAAGNVLLSPTSLTARADAASWQRARLVGSADPAEAAAAADELHAVAPHLTFVPAGQRADVVCLLLTGSGRRREKLAGALSRAPVVLARGATGEWYEVNRPVWRPASPRWWGRLACSLLTICGYLLLLEGVLLGDALSRVRPARRPLADPGPVPEGRVTFIVPTYNQRVLMDLCLPALLREAGGEHEIVLVDDAGTDDTAEYVRQTYPTVRVLRLERNQGFAGAVGAGIAASTTPLFALINNDAQVRPGFLAAMVPHFAEPDVFAVCSRIDLPEGSQVETGRVVAAFSGILEPYHVAPTEMPSPILYAGGASSIFHRARYDALGGFDRRYHPFYWEDIDLGYRAWRAGWRSVFEPGASVYHQRRATIGPRFGDDYANQAFLKNALLFVLKNVRDRRLMTQHVAYVAARVLTEGLAGRRMMRGAVRRALSGVPSALAARWGERRQGDRSDAAILAGLETPSLPAEERT